jgi:PAS domain S-box-containing protein
MPAGLAKVRVPLAIGKALICLLLTLPTLSPRVSSGAVPPKRVLIFSSEDSYIPAITILNQGLRSTLKNGLPGPVQFFNEAQDSFRISNDTYEEELVRLLKQKYEGEHFDLIFGLGPSAVKFLLKHQGELFSGIPVVSVVNDQKRLADVQLASNFTGVSGRIQLSPTLEMGLSLQPQTQRVVVVAGSAPLDVALVEQAHKEFQPYESRAEFTYLTGLPTEELRTQLAGLPDKSIVFYLAVNSNSGNSPKIFSSAEVLSFVAPSARAPIFGVSETYMGSGIIGGRLIDYEAIGIRAGETGLRILAGEKPENIPPQVVPSVTMFDWRELRRWGFDESKLPAGSIVRYRQPSFWEQYKWRIVGVLSLCVLEALLIVGLLINRARRRQTEEENERLARLAEAERRRLDEVVSNVPGIVWEARTEPGTDSRKSTFVSDYVERMLGYSMQEWLSTPGFAQTIVAPEDRERVAREAQALFESGGEGVLQFRWIAKDGRVLWVESQVAAVCDETGKPVGLRGVTMDITDRKKAEQGLAESEQRYRNVVETQTELICRYTPDTTLTFVNDAYCRYFARTRDQLIGTKFLDLIPAHTQEAALNHVASLLENPRLETHEHQVLLPDGTIGWQQWINNVVNGSDRGVELQGIGRDVTERRNAQQALRLSETRFSTMADSAPLMIWMSGPDKLCTYLNQGWLDFTGRTIEQELGNG